MGNQLADILDTDEKVLWQGKPTFIPFVASGLPFLALGILWGMIDYGFIRQIFISPSGVQVTLIPFFLLHLMPLWGSILNMLRLLLSFNNVTYAMTNKRILLRTGFWGIDFKSIDYDKVSDVQVTVNPLENLLRVGSVKINSGLAGGTAVFDSMVAIADPYDIFKQLKTTSVNIKTDWNYPNKLRPAENPGYRTQYRPKK
jgi:hypothetical protein